MQLLLGKVWGEERQKNNIVTQKHNKREMKSFSQYNTQYSQTPQILNDVIWIF